MNAPVQTHSKVVGYVLWILGGQVAFFSVSNRTDKDVVYMCDGTRQPWYTFTHWEITPGGMTGTNYNLEKAQHARPANLAAHATLVLPVYIPNDVTDAVLEIAYQRGRSGSEALKEKARTVVETYGGKLPLTPPQTWTHIQVYFCDAQWTNYPARFYRQRPL